MMRQYNIRLPDLNIVMLIGRLTRDPDLRRTSTGRAVCSFDIAVPRRIKDSVTNEWKDADPAFVSIIVWGEQAERCGERLKKGLPVYVEGRCQTHNWEGKDGTKRSRLEVVASRVQILSVMKQDSANANVDAVIGSKPIDNPNESVQQNNNDSNVTSSNEEDIPF
jgi:single-strand DNA-binding protein